MIDNMMENQRLWVQLGLVLTHFLWQGAVLALLLAVVLRVLRSRSANHRYPACGQFVSSMAWVIGVIVLAGGLLIGWLGLYRLKHRYIEPIPERIAGMVERLCEQLALTGRVRIFGSQKAAEPVAFGLLRPVVLMPVSVLTACPVELLEAMIAHELAHIRRYDLWVNFFQRVVEILLFYHPAILRVSSRIKSRTLKGDYLYYFLFHLPSGTQADTLKTSRTNIDLKPLNLVAP